MTDTTLAISGLTGLLIAGVYGYVGLRLTEREVSPSYRSAAAAFNTWWFALAGATGLGALQTLAAALGILDLGLHLSVTYLVFLFIMVALWGLLYYLLFLFTGSTRWGLPLALGYLAYFLAIVYYLRILEPTGVQVTSWNVTLTYEVTPTGPLATILGALLVIPQILAAAAYFSMVFRVQDRTRRYRILLVSGAILGWFASSFLATITGASDAAVWPLIGRAIGLLAALGILAAYLPPGWVCSWLGVHRLDEEVGTAGTS